MRETDEKATLQNDSALSNQFFDYVMANPVLPGQSLPEVPTSLPSASVTETALMFGPMPQAKPPRPGVPDPANIARPTPNGGWELAPMSPIVTSLFGDSND